MSIVPERVIVGNKREVPADMPVTLWADQVDAYVANPELMSALAWFEPVLEYLTPAELIRMRAKALVWREQTGAYPTDVCTWWEVRLGRRRGDIPHTSRRAVGHVDDDGTLHCGYCGARWSANYDGSSHADRCSLCDHITVIKEESYAG